MERNVTKRIIVILTFILLLGIFVTATPTVAQIKWKCQSVYPSHSVVGKMSVTWARDITELTGGRLQIQWAEPGAIVPARDIFMATSKGALDVGASFGSFHNAIMPETDVEVGLPFAWQNAFEIHDAFYNRGLLQEIRNIYAEHNLYYVCPQYCNLINGIGSKKPIRKPSDFKGIKIRDLGIQAEWIRYNGGSSVVIPAGELYMALKLGTIDGYHYGVTALEDFKLGEVIKYYLLEPHTGSLPINLFINMDSWKALPDDIKHLIEKYSIMLNFNHVLDYDENRKWLLYSKKYGVEGVRWSKEDIEATYNWAMKDLWEKVAEKSPRCRKLVEIVRRQMRDMGRMK